jgi:pimeloyl-ACP methyl ester carboxylesterase
MRQPTVIEASSTVHSTREHEDHARAVDLLLAELHVSAQPSFVDGTFVLQSGSGTPVLFVHGTPATSAVFLPLVSSLHGVRAHLVDRPGHGLSAAFDYDQVTDLRAHAVRFLESVLDSLGLDRVVLAGSSLGGLWSLWLALDRPQRVSGVVQLGAPPGLLSPRVPFLIGALSVPWLAKTLRHLDPPTRASARRMLGLMGNPAGRTSDAMADAIASAMRVTTFDRGCARLIQRFVRFPGRFARRDLWLDEHDLARVTQPVLFLWGTGDFVGGAHLGRRAVAAMPHAHLVECGEGHLPWLHEPAPYAAALSEFAQRVS